MHVFRLRVQTPAGQQCRPTSPGRRSPSVDTLCRLLDAAAIERRTGESFAPYDAPGDCAHILGRCVRKLPRRAQWRSVTFNDPPPSTLMSRAVTVAGLAEMFVETRRVVPGLTIGADGVARS